jgi:hypothetical protein
MLEVGTDVKRWPSSSLGRIIYLRSAVQQENFLLRLSGTPTTPSTKGGHDGFLYEKCQRMREAGRDVKR